jgi:hypothetical protein
MAAELVRERTARLGSQAAALTGSAGTGHVVDNLTGALTAVFSSVAVAIIPLITFRDELRTRLRQDRRAGGVPILAEATAMLSAYLTVEREMGRIAADADIGSLALSLVGAAHLLFADRAGRAPEVGAVHKVVAAVMADVVQRRLL